MKEAESRYTALVEQIEQKESNKTLAKEKAELANAVALKDAAKEVWVNALEKARKHLVQMEKDVKNAEAAQQEPFWRKTKTNPNIL